MAALAARSEIIRATIRWGQAAIPAGLPVLAPNL